MTVETNTRESSAGTRISPLGSWTEALQALPAAVIVRELPFLTQLDLRLDPSGPAAGAVAAVLGVAVPTTPCTAVSSASARGSEAASARGSEAASASGSAAGPAGSGSGYGEVDVLWLGPDEWLVVAQPGTDGLEVALRKALGGHGAVVDVSAQRTTISLSGPSARDVLSHGCSADLHPRVTSAGACIQTNLAMTGVTLVARDDLGTDYWLLVRSSFAPYLAAWLVDASAEY